MATPEEVAAMALGLAEGWVEDGTEQLLTLAQGDLQLVMAAAAIVQKRAPELPPLERSVEHLAFSILTAAFRKLMTRRKDAEGAD